MNSAVGYGRISNARNDGVSLVVQEQDYRSWCKHMSYTDAGWFTDDGVSGGKVNRKGLNDALAKCAEVKGAVLFARDLSRIGRSTRLLTTLNDAVANGSVKEINVGGNSLNKMTLGLLLVIAEGELDTIRERQARRAKHDRDAGLPRTGGSRRFGYDTITRDKPVTIRPDEQAHVIEAVEHVLGGGSLTSLTHDWNARGIKSVTGKPWRYQSVRAMLQREYIGVLVGDEARAEMVRTLIAQRGKDYRPLQRTFTRWLNGLLVCGLCSQLLDSHSANGKPQYGCTRNDGCNKTWIKAENVEAAIERFMKERVAIPGVSKDDEQYNGLLAARAKIVNSIDEVNDMRVDGAIQKPDWRRRRDTLDAQLAIIDESLLIIGAHASLAGSVDKWDGLDAEQKRAATLHFVGRLKVLPSKGIKGTRGADGRIRFRWERIVPERKEVQMWWRGFNR